MAFYCEPCRRRFNSQTELDQHSQHSRAHDEKKRQQALAWCRPAKPQTRHPHTASNREFRQPSNGKSPYAKPPNANKFNLQAPAIAKTPVKVAPQVIPWTGMIEESEHDAVLDALSANCHTTVQLEENGYIMHLYNASDYAKSGKCKSCNTHEKHAADRECIFHPFRRNKFNLKKPWKCCNGENARGCKISATHDFQLSLRAIAHADFKETPTASLAMRHPAVVLDCEMAGVSSGASEAILLCVTDYLTREVLFDQYMYPREPITQMRTFIHGVSKFDLENAARSGKALRGWEEARSELWKYIDSNTIIVGHALQNDLDVLRMIHPRIVDSSILVKAAVGSPRVPSGLQLLCAELPKIEIRKNKGDIHDCMEDVLATREVVLFCTLQQDGFQTWIEVKKVEEARLEKEREIKREEEKAKKAAAALAAGGGAKVKSSTGKVEEGVASKGNLLLASTEKRETVTEVADLITFSDSN